MHIDSLAIQESASTVMKVGTHFKPLVDQATVINAISEMLTAANWTPFAGSNPTGTITYGFGYPIVSGTVVTPKRVVGCRAPWVTIGDVSLTAYDPYSETPASHANCLFVAIETTELKGIANLVQAIGSIPNWGASWAPRPGGGYIVTVTATSPGPGLNFTFFSADNSWGVAGVLEGGGIEYQSQSNADSHSVSRTAAFRLKVTSSGEVNPASFNITRPIWFDFKTPYNEYGSVRYALDSIRYPNFDFRVGTGSGFGQTGYVVVANPYSLAVFCPEDNSVTGIFACAPYIPVEEDFQAAYAMFVAWPKLGGATSWAGAICIDGAPQIYAGSSNPRMLALRSPGQPLLTPSATPVITNAWVMFGRNYADPAAVVGKLWDCAMVNDTVKGGTMIGGKRYVTIAAQDGVGGKTPSTLVMRVDVVRVQA